MFPFCRVDRGRDIGEHLFDRCLHLIYIYVSHDDNRLQVRTIPFVIVITESLIFEIFDDIQIPDNISLGVFGIL